MFIFFTTSKPFEAKPKINKTHLFTQIKWLWFVIGYFKIPLKELHVRELLGKYITEGKVYVIQDKTQKNQKH